MIELAYATDEFMLTILKGSERRLLDMGVEQADLETLSKELEFVRDGIAILRLGSQEELRQVRERRNP